MQDQGIEVLIAKGGGGHYPAEWNGNYRYISNVLNPAATISQGTYALLPLERDPILYLAARHPRSSVLSPWIQDLREPSGPSVRMVAEGLRELGLSRGRIGLAGLEPDVLYVSDGSFSYAFVKELKAALPEADFVDATGLMLDVRTIKSDEELAGMEAAEHLCEGAFDYLAEVCGPGVPVRTAYGAAQQYLFAHGADTDAALGIECFPEPDNQIRYVESLERTMEAGDFITASTYVFMNGLSGHDHVFMSVGAPRPETLELVDVWSDATKAFLAGMRPGARSDELIAAAHSAIEARGYVYPGGPDVHPVGLEIPEACGPSFLIREGNERMPAARLPYRLVPGMVLALQLHVADSAGRAVEGGTSYAVTETGYRQLGNVPSGIITTAGGN